MNEHVAATSAGGSGISRAVAKPPGIQVGDLIVLSADHDNSTGVFDTPTGFTLARADGASGSGWQHHTWLRIADGSEGSTFTVSVPAGSPFAVIAVVCGVYRDIDVLDASGGNAYLTGYTGSPPQMYATAPSIAGAAGDLLICTWGWRTNAGGTPTAIPAGMAKRAEASAGSDAIVTLGDVLTLADNGPTGDRTAAATASEQNEWVSGQQLTFKPGARSGLALLL